MGVLTNYIKCFHLLYNIIITLAKYHGIIVFHVQQMENAYPWPNILVVIVINEESKWIEEQDYDKTKEKQWQFCEKC